MESEDFRVNKDCRWYLLRPLHFRDEEMSSEDNVIRSHSSLVVNCDLNLCFPGFVIETTVKLVKLKKALFCLGSRDLS